MSQDRSSSSPPSRPAPALIASLGDGRRRTVRLDPNRILLAIVVFTAVFSLGLWAKTQLEAHREVTVIIGAGDAGGESFAIVEAIAELAERYDPLLDIIVAETGGSTANVDLLSRGLIDAAAVQENVSITPDIRLMTRIYPDAFQLIARADAGIDSVSDLAGKTIALSGTSLSQRKAFGDLIGHYGLLESDMRLIPMSEAGAAWELDKGGIDAKFTIRAPGNRELRDTVRGTDVVFVPIRQADALRLNESTIQPGIIPRGSYQGNPPVPPRDLETAVVNRILVTSVNEDADIVERLTRLIYDHRRELTEATPLVGFMETDTAQLATSTLPLHDGARRYYERDNPTFLQENVEVLAFYLTVLAGVVSLMLRLNDRRQKSRSDGYTREIIRVYNDAVDDPAPDLTRYRNRMMDIFSRVIRDAESGMMSSNGFDFLSFTWDEMNDAIVEVVATKTRDTARERERNASVKLEGAAQ